MELGATWQRLVLTALLFALLLVPLGSLIWKLGVAGHPPRWGSSVAWHHLRSEAILLAADLIRTLLTALFTGALTASVALVGCWLARDCGWLRWLLFSVLTWAWVLPGSVVGIALHGVIQAIVRHDPQGTLTDLLYRGPSPVPLIWAQMLRTLPAAVVFLWPIVRIIPRELLEAARLETPLSHSEFMYVVWPMTWRGGLVTALAMSALCLGEVAASLRVDTPGWESFTKLLFDRMHYGVDNNVAALSILMLSSLVVCAMIIGCPTLVRVRWRHARQI
jgi:ABC-type Fe3+ transport system permease subunit